MRRGREFEEDVQRFIYPMEAPQPSTLSRTAPDGEGDEVQAISLFRGGRIV